MPHSNQSSASSLASDYYAYHAYASGSDGRQSALSNTPTARQEESAPRSYSPAPHHNTTLHHQQSQEGTLRKQTSIANIAVLPFSAFRSQTPTFPSGPPNFHQKPLPSQASPRINSFAGAPSPRVADATASRPFSLDSSLPRRPVGSANERSPPSAVERSSQSFPVPPGHDRAVSIGSRLASEEQPASHSRHFSDTSTSLRHPQPSPAPSSLHHPQYSISSITSSAYSQELPVESTSESHTSMNGYQPAPSMTLESNGVQRTLTDESISSAGSHYSNTSQPRPKSPVGKLGAFFGWKGTGAPQQEESPTTAFSDKSLSPLPSPGGRRNASTSMARLTPPGLDISKANLQTQQRTSGYFSNPDTPLLLGTPEQNAHVQELEKELHHISTELANSIRREMELEDELERARLEIPIIPQEGLGRRGSDYFSDSGASSTRFPVADADAQIEKVEGLRRKAEQEKAQIKLEMTEHVQRELNRRKELEQLVHDLEDQVQKKLNQADEQGDLSEKIEDLESTLSETRRRLGEEKLAKDNFEVLYSATREELEAQRNERDNLRDEIVPQLKARVDGLEVEAEERRSLMYENTRMQQELQQLREEQRAFKDGRFSSIAEEADIMSPPLGRSGLSRSGSLAKNGGKRGGSLTRSGSTRETGGRARSGSMTGGTSTGALNAEGVKEIEDQRDALHKALQLLIKRHDKHQREHVRAIKKLTHAREQAERQYSPKRSHYQREVSFLKEEVTTLRKRTEDALEQKWQYEKGLSGLKIDLDRAEEETRGLRIILEEHDIAPGSSSNAGIELNTDTDNDLRLTISNAENERDHARQVAEAYRAKAVGLQNSPNGSGDTQQLFASAERMEKLAEELEKQVQANLALRARLADAVAKGEHEQRDSTAAIQEMQRRIASMEDSVLAAQAHSETTLSNHETEARRIEEASSPRLQRLRIAIPADPSRLSPSAASAASVSPLFKPGGGSRSPRLAGKKLSESSLLEMSRTQMLERKVRELEALLREAEGDMQAVVGRVNAGQYEVAELQGERDAALTQMRKLQAMIVEERERAEAVM